MTGLYRLKLKPTAPWRTPWQADTLTGMLLATAARTLGQDILRRRLIDPMLAGRPPFVLSDALPGELLPFPIYLRLSDWPPDTNLKAVKRARWLDVRHFEAACAGQCPPADILLSDSDVFCDRIRQHNTLSRLDDSTFAAEQGGGIFQRPETLLDAKHAHDYFSVYFRMIDSSVTDLLLELFHELSLTGFGADTSTGRGQFDLLDDPQAARQLDATPPAANGVISLSTFQPGPNDPTEGYWDVFPKFGKLGPDLGLSDRDVHKNTLILFRPGACFRGDPATPSLGRAIPMRELLPAATADQLRARDINIIHPAFGLTLPIAFSGAFHHA